MERVAERLMRYAVVDTKSDTGSGTTPSSPGQLRLAQLLVQELQEMGLQDAARVGNR